jgi:hypothetical protein
MEIRAFNGKTIFLTEERWQHIISRHPELEESKKLFAAVLANPDEAYIDPRSAIHALKRIEGISDLLVIIFSVNGEGYIRTAYYINAKRKTRRYRLFRKLKPS